jgi:anion-transporting  ArsA/GET3 family ATPase
MTGTDHPTGTDDPLRTRALDVDALLDDDRTRIIVCCGSGGVGKTTTAAALGVRAAERGRRTVVLTIDPARRLAQSMGLTELDNTPRRVEGVSGESGTGELFAMMLDMKRTFDEIVEAHADPKRAQAILDNPFYQSLSAGFAGTQEYMAMEKLGQLKAEGTWDLIIVDTPPSRSALDFLDAPERLGSFLDGRFVRILSTPAKVGGRSMLRFLDVGMSMVTGVLGKVLGAHMLRDVQTFIAATESMFGGFRERADATYRLLQAPGTAFLVVAAPERDALREAAYFVERLAADRMPLAGLVLNRVHTTDAARLTAERATAGAETLEGQSNIEASTPVTGPGKKASSPFVDTAIAGTDPDQQVSAQNAPEAADGADPTQGKAASEGVKPSLQGKANSRTPHGQAEPPPPSPESMSDQHGHHDDPVSGAAAEEPARYLPPTEEGQRHGDGHGADAPGGATPDDGSPGYDASILAAGLLRLHAERMQVIARERRTRDRFVSVHPEVPVVEVAALPGDVHDLDGLRAIGERLAKQA